MSCEWFRMGSVPSHLIEHGHGHEHEHEHEWSYMKNKIAGLSCHANFDTRRGTSQKKRMTGKCMTCKNKMDNAIHMKACTNMAAGAKWE